MPPGRKPNGRRGGMRYERAWRPRDSPIHGMGIPTVAARPLGRRSRRPVRRPPMRQYIESSLREASSALDALRRNPSVLGDIEAAAALLIDTFERKSRVFSCGNGGSMCDAMHFAEELTGRYRHDRGALAATAISDPGHLTCVGNDLGYEHVFSRYLEAHGRKGDCLVALSTSGTSKNIVRASQTAASLDMNVIVLSGRQSQPLSALKQRHPALLADRSPIECRNCTSRCCTSSSS